MPVPIYISVATDLITKGKAVSKNPIVKTLDSVNQFFKAYH